MKKIITTTTITVLFSIGVLLVGLVLSQNTKKTENFTVDEEKQDMKNLVIKNNLQAHGIEVVAPTDADFNAELQQYTGKYNEVIPLVDGTKPFSFFIKNNSSKEVVGIALRWEFVKSNGEVQKSNQIETSPGVLMGIKPQDPFMIGKTSLINNNSHRFMSYFSDIAQQLLNVFKSNTYKRFEYKLSSEQAQNYISDVESRKRMIFKDVLNVSVFIDAIIFNDGTFIGDNQSFLFEQMSAMIQARRDFIKKLREAKQSGKSDTEAFNEFISRTGLTAADRQPTAKYPVNGKEAFDYTYKWQTANYIDEVNRKRTITTDRFILKDLLVVEDSSFIDLKRK